VAAAKQSRRSRIPTVYDLHSTPELAELIAEVRAQGAAVFILHEQASERLTTLLGQSAGERLGEIYLVVGPEGGISEREVEMFTQAGASLALLGTEVLRSSTAGSAGLCAVNIALGRW
jgi:RNA methyltransferase, rsmE family